MRRVSGVYGGDGHILAEADAFLEDLIGGTSEALETPAQPESAGERAVREADLSFLEDLIGGTSEALETSAQPGSAGERAVREADLFFADLTGEPLATRGAPWRGRAEAEEAAEPRAGNVNATVQWVQQALNRALGGSLATDGVLGPQTQSALQRFQQRRGLTADRRLLGRTLRALAADSGTLPPSVGPVAPTSQRRRPDLSVPCPGTATVLDAFVFASATPTAAHRAIIAQLAEAIVASATSSEPVHLVCLEGHTDSVGANDSNLVLGQRRADAVKAQLIAAIDRASPGHSQRIGFWSMSAGETEPIAPNTSDASRARNRRVVVHLNNRWQGSTETAQATVVLAGRSAQAAEKPDLAEPDPQQVFHIEVGRSVDLICTGRPLPVGTPAYTWVSADTTIATITQQGTAQTHPNRITIRALRPGTTTVSVTYRSQSAGNAVVQRTIVAQPVLEITRPEAQGIWVMLFEPENPGFLTQGIAQGAALWTGAGVQHGAHANGGGDRAGAAGVKVRAQERGLVVQGRVDAAASGVRIEVFAGATAIPVKASPSGTAANQLAAMLAAPASGATTRDFEAVIFFDNPSSRFGPVQVRARSVGLATARTATADVLLVGAQIALVNDRSSNVDGRTPGRILTESDERVVIDFIHSPQPTPARLLAQTRARRMITYDIDHRHRPLSATVATVVGRPEMPMWMAELQLVGIDALSLATFLATRTITAVGVVASWTLRTSWDSPNATSRVRPYLGEWTATTIAVLGLNATGTLAGLQPTGEVEDALMPVPTQLKFPVAGRRVARVIAGGITRRWGRQSDTPQLPAIVFEHQPILLDVAGREIMRGGDGELHLSHLSVDTDVDPGRISHPTGVRSPPAGTPLAMLPTFRVQGVNLAADDRRPLVDALVEEYVTAHAKDAWVAMLRLVHWQETVWRVLQDASIAGMHFNDWSRADHELGGQHFGTEQDMPVFRPPARYGWAQLDSPTVSDDGVWSFMDNAREAIGRLIGQNARDAHGAMRAHFPSPPDRLAMAAFRREVVRRYNGFTEMHWNGTTWEIQPTVPQRDSNGNPNGDLNYPNAVLGTTIVYFTGTGVTATFPWPIAFPETQFGPDL